MTKSIDYPIADKFIIKDLETLKKLTHPQRIEILQNLGHPKTVKDIALAIDADPTKLYYHIRQMEQIEVIKVVETNIVSGIVEKTYGVTAKEYTVDKSLFSGDDVDFTDDDFSNMVSAIFNSTLNHVKKSAKAGLINLNEDGPKRTTAIMSGQFLLTEEQLEKFGQKMQEVMTEFGEYTEQNSNSEDSQGYVYTIAFFPKPPPDNVQG
ncbi:MAG: helix-turn-helix domain-containing protein [Chloroflexota bacterium]